MKITQKQLNSAMKSYRMGLEIEQLHGRLKEDPFLGITMAEYSAIMRAIDEEYGPVAPRAPSLQRINARLQ